MEKLAGKETRGRGGGSMKEADGRADGKKNGERGGGKEEIGGREEGSKRGVDRGREKKVSRKEVRGREVGNKGTDKDRRKTDKDKRRADRGVNKKIRGSLVFSGLCLFLAVLFTVLVAIVDVQPAGVEGTLVGFSDINADVAVTFSFNEFFYKVTNYLGYLLAAIPLFYTGVGIYQLIRRGDFRKVDKSLLLLAGFYLAVGLVYIVFDKVLVLNYRPVLIDGALEPSYPSSHTLFSLCFSISAMMMNLRLFGAEKRRLVRVANVFLGIFAVLVIVGRFLSGVHWLTDIVGGIVISTALLAIFYTGLVVLEKYRRR